MPQQTIFFTVMPSALQINPAAPAVSVYVSPRLVGGDRLGMFPDWLDWTARLVERGLALTFRSGGSEHTAQVDSARLRPDLWREMFNEGTFVRSHTFDDYTGRTIFSYSSRLALSTIKSIYQQAGLALGIPDRQPTHPQERDYSPHRQYVKALLSGLAVNWSQDAGERMRLQYRAAFKEFAPQAAYPHPYNPQDLAADGTLAEIYAPGSTQAVQLNNHVSKQFAVYTHMPQGAPLSENPPDFETIIDFHQALSSLNSYPELLRALGIVFDFDLPADFLEPAPLGSPGHLSVVRAEGPAWEIETLTPPDIQPRRTAYLYFPTSTAADAWKIFTTAPRTIAGSPSPYDVFGLLVLDPSRFGLAQVDLESGMYKTILLAEAWQNGDGPASSSHPDVFDESATLPSLRSGGFSLFADHRALSLLHTFQQNQKFNQELEGSPTATPTPFYAEDLTGGYRLDIWDSHTGDWHSLHRRSAQYDIGSQTFSVPEEEGFAQLAAAQPAPDPENPTPDDLYLNESVARWTGWSLSAPFPGKPLSRDPDPENALKEDPAHPPNEPATPFPMTTHFKAARGSLPALRFGRRYRLRVRPVDVCGNSMKHDDPAAHLLAFVCGLPRDPNGVPYLRYEPVAAPAVVLREEQGVTLPGSQLERLVIRTFNDTPGKDADPPDLAGSERFIVPPSTSVEMGERMGMFDDASGKLVQSTSMYNLIGQRDQGQLNHVEVEVAGQVQKFPLEQGETLDSIPYLPDVLARGAALRDLPGTGPGTLAQVEPGPAGAAPAPFQTLDDANPRAGSALLASFGGGGDWQKLQPFRLVLQGGESSPGEAGTPVWDSQARTLTVFLPAAHQFFVPLSSYLLPDDMKRMGVWAWLREAVDLVTSSSPGSAVLDPGLDMEQIAHLLQRALEGGHWMLTPPRILALVHAVQQPLGRPEFTGVTVQHQSYRGTANQSWEDETINADPAVLQTAPEKEPSEAAELAPVTAWRRLNSTSAYLLGGLGIHAASTARIDLLAEWEDEYDDPATPREQARDENGEYVVRHSAQVDEIHIPVLKEGSILTGKGTGSPRHLAYYDPGQDLLIFARAGDQLGKLMSGQTIFYDAAPRHQLNDTRRHRVRYTARASSRFREYFPQDEGLDFTRESEAVVVDVPASARPAAPVVDSVIPAFGWQRQTQSNLKRSVRFGGVLRVYLERPWFSSGSGELLGVALYDPFNGVLTDREPWKAYITQWGADPIWQAQRMLNLPGLWNFPNAAAKGERITLPGRAPGRVDVAGFPVSFDYERQKWFADLVIDPSWPAYTPFVRLALVRYQPFALPDARISAVALADYAQLTPERSAVLTADPYQPRRLRLTVSGPAPSGPEPQNTGGRPAERVRTPTRVVVTLQERDPGLGGELGWRDAPTGTAQVNRRDVAAADDPQGFIRWTGTVDFSLPPEPGRFRLLVREYEYISANFLVEGPDGLEQPRRLIYAEALELDATLVAGPHGQTGTVLEE